MSLGGFSIMYKVQVLGPQNVLHKYEPFLLNTPISLLLFILSSIIVTSSSCVLYMYGYQVQLGCRAQYNHRLYEINCVSYHFK